MALRARMIRQTLDRYVPDLQDAERQQQLNARYERRLAECQRFAQRFEQALADLVEVLIIAQDEAWQARGLGERMQEFSRNMDALSHAMREMEKMAEPPEVSLLLPKEPEVFLPPLRENEPPPPPPRQEPPQRS